VAAAYRETAQGAPRAAGEAGDRALINDPVLLLADEPTSDLDEQTEREIMALLMNVNRKRKTTLVLVTHNLALASEAEQIVQIADGTITRVAANSKDG
jgi:ABC-type lipoprotein export system ATPase subunit